MNIGQATAKRVSELLKQHNITQYRLAKETAITHNTMTNIINAKTKSVNLNTIFLLCKAFNIEISDFFDAPVFKTCVIDID